jgi:hypothetical protein
VCVGLCFRPTGRKLKVNNGFSRCPDGILNFTECSGLDKFAIAGDQNNCLGLIVYDLIEGCVKHRSGYCGGHFAALAPVTLFAFRLLDCLT